MAEASNGVQLKGDEFLAKPNYGFEKRQRELAKKQKKEAKRLKKASADLPPSGKQGLGSAPEFPPSQASKDS